MSILLPCIIWTHALWQSAKPLFWIVDLPKASHHAFLCWDAKGHTNGFVLDKNNNPVCKLIATINDNPQPDERPRIIRCDALEAE